MVDRYVAAFEAADLTACAACSPRT